MPSAIAAREQEGAITRNMNWDVYIESWGERPDGGQRGDNRRCACAVMAALSKPKISPT